MKKLTDIQYTENVFSLVKSNDEVFHHIEHELQRQHNQIELIASENFVSPAVLAAMGSIFTNKYAEGYPNARYYSGCENVDAVENIAIKRACELFGCNFANVQPHSGAQANMAVFYAFLKPGDTFLGMDLAAGGHLTHGAKPTVSGKWFNPVSYMTNKETGLIDYDLVEEIALKCQPKLIIAGGSSYPREIDFERFGEIARKIGAILMCDVAHYAGLIATKQYPNPFPHADVVTTTTHKTLRGPRGGMIMWNKEEYTKKINSAVFPGTQGGPLMHVIAAKAVAFGEALTPEFKEYILNVKKNAVILAEGLAKGGAKIITGATQSHMVIADVYSEWGATGRKAADALERAGMTCNKNAIPHDVLSVAEASGIRLGTPAATSRGFNGQDFDTIAEMIHRVLIGLKNNSDDNSVIENQVRAEILKMCEKIT